MSQPPRRSGWSRLSIIILVVVLLLLVAIAIGDMLFAGAGAIHLSPPLASLLSAYAHP